MDEGWDVWLENWRASIDVPRRRWTLDDAAVHDHPAAVRTVLEHTKADEVRAVIHCQGSTSFMMSAVAGLVPDVSVVVSNAVSLHPVVNRKAKLKLRWMIPPTARVMGYLDPQWGETGAPWVLPKLITGLVRVTHRECDNMVCKLASFTYGTGEPTLWRHENLNRETHEWLRHEFADVPLTFFEQILRSVEAGHLVAADDHPGAAAVVRRRAPEDEGPLRVLRRRAERLLRAREPAPHPGLVRVPRPRAPHRHDRAQLRPPRHLHGGARRERRVPRHRLRARKDLTRCDHASASSGSAVGTLSSTASRSPCPSTAVTPRR